MDPRRPGAPTRALGYVRVSTTEQHVSGAGLAAQEQTIRAEADRRGWTLLDVVGEPDGASSTSLERPGLRSALAVLRAGGADVLVVHRLDRLSRSVAQGGEVLARAQREGWSVVALDFGLDTTTPAGEMVAHVVLSTAQYERRMIGLRTREALAARRSQGVRLGRPRSLPLHVLERVVAERRAGSSLSAIAAALNEDGVPTGQGGRAWRHSSVAAVLRSQDAAPLLAPPA